jgi:hypothetical protein
MKPLNFTCRIRVYIYIYIYGKMKSLGRSENPWGRSDVDAMFVTPLGHSLVVTD